MKTKPDLQACKQAAFAVSSAIAIGAEGLREASAAENAMQDLVDYTKELEAALAKISAIRDHIIATQRINWSADIYPLVAALDGVGFTGTSVRTATDRSYHDGQEGVL